MALGAGKYDALCTLVREATEAKVAIVVIVAGNRGSGFSAQMASERDIKMSVQLRATITVLESLLKAMKEDLVKIEAEENRT
jgi:hypothetical protein